MTRRSFWADRMREAEAEVEAERARGPRGDLAMIRTGELVKERAALIRQGLDNPQRDNKDRLREIEAQLYALNGRDRERSR